MPMSNIQQPKELNSRTRCSAELIDMQRIIRTAVSQQCITFMERKDEGNMAKPKLRVQTTYTETVCIAKPKLRVQTTYTETVRIAKPKLRVQNLVTARGRFGVDASSPSRTLSMFRQIFLSIFYQSPRPLSVFFYLLPVMFTNSYLQLKLKKILTLDSYYIPLQNIYIYLILT